jgi:hypothetical protein
MKTTSAKSSTAAEGDSEGVEKYIGDEHTIHLEQFEEEILKTDFNVGLTNSDSEKGWKSLAENA